MRRRSGVLSEDLASFTQRIFRALRRIFGGEMGKINTRPGHGSLSGTGWRRRRRLSRRLRDTKLQTRELRWWQSRVVQDVQLLRRKRWSRRRRRAVHASAILGQFRSSSSAISDQLIHLKFLRIRVKSECWAAFRWYFQSSFRFLAPV